MLNDLYMMAKNLEKQGIKPDPIHFDIHDSDQCHLIVYLHKDGKPPTLQTLEKDEGSHLWTHRNGQHNSFPAVRLTKPLLAQSQSEKIKAALNSKKWKDLSLDDKRAILESLDWCDINPKYRVNNKSNLMLSPWSQKELQVVLDDDSPDLVAIRTLLERFPRNMHDAEALTLSLAKAAYEYAQQAGDTAVTTLKELLVGPQQKRCYFDVRDQDLGHAVADERTKKGVIAALCSRDDAIEHETPESSETASVVRSALSDKAKPPLGKKRSHPQPNLPISGQTYLYSNNKDIPCLSRYGMDGSNAFPVTRHEALFMGAALSFLTEKNRQGETWSKVLSPSKTESHLIVAWSESNPAADKRLASLFGESGANDNYDLLEEAYEKRCKVVLSYLKQICNDDPSVLVHLWQLGKLDEGRRQIVYADEYTVNQLKEGCASWLEAANNMPPILFRALVKKEGRAAQKEPRDLGLECPSPEDIFTFARMCYRCSGGGISTVTPDNPRVLDSKSAAFQPSQVYRLMFPKSSEQSGFLNHVLETSLRLGGDLLIDAGGCQTSRKIQPFLESDMKKACTAAALLAILLYKLGTRKEEYMKGQAYTLGCLLREADKLHKQYCFEVRNKSDAKKPLPTQLMGNAMFQVVAERPAEGLNRLEEKIRIYIGWGDTSQSTQARRILSDLSEIATDIASAGDEIPERFSVQERAQLLLGYLAGYSKSEDVQS